MNTKRKILFLMPSLRGGGAERTLINLLHKIDYDSYDVDLVVVSKYGPYVNQIPNQVDVTYLYKNNFLVRILGYLHRTYNVEWFFRKKMSGIEKAYDVGISFLDSNYTHLLFYTNKIEKRIAFIHGSYLTHSNYEKFYKYEDYRDKLIEKKFSNLDGIYFVSDDSMSDFIELFGEFSDMGVVYNLIDKEAVRKKSGIEKQQLSFDDFTFSAVGSLLPIKGFDRLVRAAKIVMDRGYEFKIYLAGTGPEKKTLIKMIEENNLEDRIVLLGYVNNPYPLMNNSDVFVMSSVSEALPTVLCEAMTLGVPSLVTDCSGCRGLVKNGEFGVMADQDDQDLAKKMMYYMDNPEALQHYSKKSLERAEIFDEEKILKAYSAIFEGNEPSPV